MTQLLLFPNPALQTACESCSHPQGTSSSFSWMGLEGCESGCKFCWSPGLQREDLYLAHFSARLGIALCNPSLPGLDRTCSHHTQVCLRLFSLGLPTPDGGFLGQEQSLRHLWVPCTWHTPWHRVGAKVTSSHATSHAVQRLAWLVYSQDEGPLPSWEAWWQPCFCSAHPGLSPLFL